MFFVTLGLILLITSFMLGRLHMETGDKVNLRPWAWTARVTAFVMIIGGLFFSCIIFVPAGFRGVLLQFSAVKGTLSEGIHAVVPYVNSVELMEVRTQKESSEASAASKDLQVVTTSLALNFHADSSKVGELYRNVGLEYIHRIIDPAVQESIKMVTARYTAEELIKERAKVKEEVELDITKRLAAYNIIVEPAGLSITNFNFSPEFNLAIEAKQVAQQDAEKQRYVLQRADLERQTLITQARGASEAAKLNAAALQVQGGSKVIAREWIQKWDGHVPTVSGGAGGGVIIDINSLLTNQQR
jgi:regulator of protease activity HflC (stomatin/prohibitin superfamily)